jgi:PEP-CTERM motif
MYVCKPLTLAALILCVPLAAFSNQNLNFSNVGGTGAAIHRGTGMSNGFSIAAGTQATVSSKNVFEKRHRGSFYQASGNTGPAIPEPGSLVLLGTGLIGLAHILRRKLSGAKIEVR